MKVYCCGTRIILSLGLDGFHIEPDHCSMVELHRDSSVGDLGKGWNSRMDVHTEVVPTIARLFKRRGGFLNTEIRFVRINSGQNMCEDDPTEQGQRP